MSQGRPLLRPQRPGRVAKVFYGLLFVALPALAVLMVADTWHFARNHESARAEVIHVETKCHGGITLPCVIDTTVRFVTSSGRTIETVRTDAYGSGQVGDFFTIYYDPNDPGDTRTPPSWPIGWVLIMVVIIYSWLASISILFNSPS